MDDGIGRTDGRIECGGVEDRAHDEFGVRAVEIRGESGRQVVERSDGVPREFQRGNRGWHR